MSNSKYSLSLIICVHNTSTELFERCLNSIKESTLKNVEIVIVDDGSTENYEKLLKKYGNIKYIKTELCGTLSARIVGAKMATAPFVCYVDSDDTMSFEYYEALLKRQAQTDAEIVIGDWAFDTANAKYVCKKDSTISKNFILKEELVLKRFFMKKGKEISYFVLWNKLISRSLLRDCVSQIEKLDVGNLSYAEDVLMTYFLFRKAKCVSNVHLGYYFYRQHSDNETSKDTFEKLEEHFLASAKVFDIIEADLKSDDTYVYVEDGLNAWKAMDYKSYLSKIKHSHNAELSQELKNAYHLAKPLPHVSANNYIYAHQRVLPDNLSEVDDAIKKVYYNNKYLKVFAKRGSYSFDTLLAIRRLFNKRIEFVKSKKLATVVMPKEKISLRNRLLHNIIVYRTGMMLIPKGSKVRKNLKAKI